MNNQNRSFPFGNNSDCQPQDYFTHYSNQNKMANTNQRRSSMREQIYSMSIEKQDTEKKEELVRPVNVEETVMETNTVAAVPEMVTETPDFLDRYQTDYTYMKSLYPLIVRKIQVIIEDQCDQLEYAGSCMFDEYPDKVHMSALINTIYSKALALDHEDPELQAEEISGNPLSTQGLRRCSGFCCAPTCPMSDYNQYGRPNWMRNLVEVMFYNEVLYRKRRYCHRNCW